MSRRKAREQSEKSWSRRLKRAKRIAAALRDAQPLPCGCRIRLKPCEHDTLCDCPIEVVLCECELPPLLYDARIRQLGDFLAEADPENYADRPIADEPRKAVSSEGRIADLQRREDNEQAIFHPDDVHADQTKLGQSISFSSRSPQFAGIAPCKDDDEPWWDEYEQQAMDETPMSHDIAEHPLYYPGQKDRPFREKPNAVQRAEIERAEHVARARMRLERQRAERQLARLIQAYRTLILVDGEQARRVLKAIADTRRRFKMRFGE